jgi:hypothetical protein
MEAREDFMMDLIFKHFCTEEMDEEKKKAEQDRINTILNTALIYSLA